VDIAKNGSATPILRPAISFEAANPLRRVAFQGPH
jgi:hypothetical protein